MLLVGRKGVSRTAPHGFCSHLFSSSCRSTRFSLYITDRFVVLTRCSRSCSPLRAPPSPLSVAQLRDIEGLHRRSSWRLCNLAGLSPRRHLVSWPSTRDNEVQSSHTRRRATACTPHTTYGHSLVVMRATVAVASRCSARKGAADAHPQCLGVSILFLSVASHVPQKLRSLPPPH